MAGLISGTWGNAFVYTILLALILYRPRGLTGSPAATLR